jgi:hypothetical protein
MLQGTDLLKRRKQIKIKKRKSGKKFYIVSLLFFICLIICFTTYFFLSRQWVFISPLAKIKYQQNIKLEELLNKANINFTKISTQADSSLLVVLSGKEEVIFSPKKDLLHQIASLQLITKRLTIEGKRFKGLDFRYDKPMIKF